MEWPPQNTGLFAVPECIACCVAETGCPLSEATYATGTSSVVTDDAIATTSSDPDTEAISFSSTCGSCSLTAPGHIVMVETDPGVFVEICDPCPDARIYQSLVLPAGATLAISGSGEATGGLDFNRFVQFSVTLTPCIMGSATPDGDTTFRSAEGDSTVTGSVNFTVDAAAGYILQIEVVGSANVTFSATWSATGMTCVAPTP
jgi:hypothetical protein